MASRKNDELRKMTVEGSVNLYDGQRCQGTAGDKGLAARLGGHSYNILSGKSKDEIYLKHLRHSDHFVDSKNRHTRHFLGDRRRKFSRDPRAHVEQCLRCPEDHPRSKELGQRRTEIQLTQMENPRSYNQFQHECRDAGISDEGLKKRYSINNKLYANEVEHKINGTRMASTGEFNARRSERLERSTSCPSFAVTAPVRSLAHATATDHRKGASQLSSESANFATVRSAHTYTTSVDTTELGRQHRQRQNHCSVNRIENHDFGATRKNNHYSSQDKLTRCDGFYMRPRFGTTNNSVKYDIINNERKFFHYA